MHRMSLPAKEQEPAIKKKKKLKHSRNSTQYTQVQVKICLLMWALAHSILHNETIQNKSLKIKIKVRLATLKNGNPRVGVGLLHPAYSTDVVL